MTGPGVYEEGIQDYMNNPQIYKYRESEFDDTKNSQKR